MSKQLLINRAKGTTDRGAHCERRSAERMRLFVPGFGWFSRDDGPQLREEEAQSFVMSRAFASAAGDRVDCFLKARTVSAPGEMVQSSVLCAAFNAWSLANSLHPWSCRRLSQTMERRGWQRKKSGVVFFVGLRLIEREG
jgi:hypothetical protein